MNTSQEADWLKRIQVGETWDSCSLEHLTGDYYVFHFTTYHGTKHELIDLSKDDGASGLNALLGVRLARTICGRFLKTHQEQWLAALTKGILPPEFL